MISIEAIVGLITVALMIAGTVYKFGQQNQKISDLEADLADVKLQHKEDLEKLSAKNDKQHEELFNSRNDTGKVLERLTALFESMEKKQESMDNKLDILIERRNVQR